MVGGILSGGFYPGTLTNMSQISTCIISYYLEILFLAHNPISWEPFVVFMNKSPTLTDPFEIMLTFIFMFVWI